MKPLKASTLIALALATSACLHRPVAPPTVADVETALRQGDYALAWQLAHDPAAAPDIAALQPQLRERQAQAEQAALRRARQQASQGQWLAALQTVDQGLAHWPHSEALYHARQELDQQQLAALVALRTELFASEAGWLQGLQTLPARLALFSDPTAQAMAADLARRREAAMEELLALGEWHAAHDQWRQARTALRAAASLDAAHRQHPALVRAERHLADANQRARDNRAEALREQARERLARYRRSEALEDLIAARQFIQTHRRDAALNAEHETVERLCRERISREVAAGDALYARGEYQQAHEAWRKIAPLASDDAELEKKIARTRRVLESLQELKASP